MNPFASRSPLWMLFATALALPANAGAGTIGFKINSTVSTGTGVTLELQVTNTGDEAALSLKPVVVYGEQEIEAAEKSRLAAGATHTWQVKLDDNNPPPGSHIIITRLGYTDGNAYPFQVLAAAPFSVGQAGGNRVSGNFSVPTLKDGGWTKCRLNLHWPNTRTGSHSVRILIPEGLEGRALRHEVDPAGKRLTRHSFELKTTTLLPGSNVGIFAVVRGSQDATLLSDQVSGIVRVERLPTKVAPISLRDTLLFSFIVFVLLQLLGGKTAWWSFSSSDREVAATQPPWEQWLGLALIALPVAFLAYQYPWKDLLAPTTAAGGDMASLYYPTVLMAEQLLPSGHLTGWTMGNYAGFPVFHFYSTLPFALISIIGKLLPMQPVFKIVTLLGPTLLPLAAAYLFATMGYGSGGRALAAASVLPFLFQQGNSMWGGNIPSVLAGEYCHALGITLSLFFLGTLLRVTEGKMPWTIPALLLTCIGLTHTFAFISALWFVLYFLWPRRDVRRLAAPVLPVLFVSALLLCFWGIPLPGRLQFTTEWSMIWNIKDWKEVIPVPIWPAAVLALLNLCVTAASSIASILRRTSGFDMSWLAGVKAASDRREGLLVFVLAGAGLLYLLAPAVGFPDIRFIPIAQIFVGLLAADFCYWAGNTLANRVAYVTCLVLATLLWAQFNIGYVPAWLTWNYSGYEGKRTWPLFEKINDHVRGTIDDPRVVFEHSELHNRFGSSRAFENLPLFSGRSTLEGVFHQASINSPYVFYLQSEVSERGSGPFPQYTYTRLNPDLALPHLRMYNVDTVIAVTDKARAAYDSHPDFERTLLAGSYAVYSVRGGDTGYVGVPSNEPVLYEGADWKLAFYRWFRRPELSDIPLVPASLVDPKQRREFALRTDSISRIPREAIDEDCSAKSTLEQHRVVFDTNCPGLPHIVKVSYFPRWKAVDGSPLFPVSPGFMLVYPRGEHLELVYGRNPLDWISIGLSLMGLLWLSSCVLSRRLLDRSESGLVGLLGPVLVVFERRRLLISVLIVTSMATAGVAARRNLTGPRAAYARAQDAYKKRDFETAVHRLGTWVAEDKDTFQQATALYQLGVSHSELGHHTAAIQVHERLRFEFPNVDYGAGTLYHLARNYKLLGLVRRASDYRALLDKNHPETNWSKRLDREWRSDSLEKH